MNILTRYKINFDRVANMLIPRFVTDRRRILFTQSLLHPLKSLNDKFSSWAIEKSIEASMTSQVFYFEWFLNRKFRKYFDNKLDRIVIGGGGLNGVPVFYEGATDDGNFIVKKEEEGTDGLKPLYKFYEDEGDKKYSFVVYVPATTKISQEELVNQVKYWVDKYKIAGKTYTIKINEGV